MTTPHDKAQDLLQALDSCPSPHLIDFLNATPLLDSKSQIDYSLRILERHHKELQVGLPKEDQVWN